MTTPPIKNRIGSLCLLLVLGACRDGSGSSGSATPPLDPLQVAALRQAMINRGIQALPPFPARRASLVTLGQALYFDPLLSGELDVSCATCHLPEFAAGDGRTLPSGVGGLGNGPARAMGATIPRNSPSLLSAHFTETMFWDSRVSRVGGTLTTPAGALLTPTLEAAFEPGLEVVAAQSIFPVTSRGEMRGQIGSSELGDIADGDFQAIWSALMERLLDIPAYVTLFAQAYPGVAVTDLEFTHAGNAIAAFEFSAFAKTDSPLARFLQGDSTALNAEQIRGGLEFFGTGRCDRCHTGSAFTDGLHHNIGLPQFGPGKGSGSLGVDDFGREGITGDPADRYRFRTPSLINVELTAPYGHAGQFRDLRSIVDHYVDPEASLRSYDASAHVDDPALLGTLVNNTEDVLDRLAPELQGRTPFDVDALVAFLTALTADDARDLSAVIPASLPSGLPLR